MTPDHVHRGGGGAEDLQALSSIVLVGVVTEVCPHPNADKLRICRTDIGGGDIREIVCGGTNLTRRDAGGRPAPAPCAAGTARVSRWKLQESKLGVKSYGMICAAWRSGWGICSPPMRRPTSWTSAPLT